MTPETSSTVLRAAVCGAGMRSRKVWQRHLAESAGFELVGVMDPAQASLDASVEEGHVTAEQTYLELDAMLEAVHPDVLVACPIHTAHAAAVRAGLDAGAHVLVEKPFATELSDAVQLTALAEERGLLVGVVQNWRTKSAGKALRAAIEAGRIGEVSHIAFRYLRDREKPHLPDYLFEEEDPLLYAMAIHHFDLFRYALGQEIVRVSGHAARPRWSRYRDNSINDLWMETDGGVVISYVASFSSRNAHIPQESLQVEGELGTLYNESAYFEPPLMLSLRDDAEPVDLTKDVEIRDQQGQYDLADGEVLLDFHAAVTTGSPLISPARENLGTLAVIDAARRALHEDGPVAVEIPEASKRLA